MFFSQDGFNVERLNQWGRKIISVFYLPATSIEQFRNHLSTCKLQFRNLPPEYFFLRIPYFRNPRQWNPSFLDAVQASDGMSSMHMTSIVSLKLQYGWLLIWIRLVLLAPFLWRQSVHGIASRVFGIQCIDRVLKRSLTSISHKLEDCHHDNWIWRSSLADCISNTRGDPWSEWFTRGSVRVLRRWVSRGSVVSYQWILPNPPSCQEEEEESRSSMGPMASRRSRVPVHRRRGHWSPLGLGLSRIWWKQREWCLLG